MQYLGYESIVVTNIAAFADTISARSTYAVADSNWKYAFDRYNDVIHMFLVMLMLLGVLHVLMLMVSLGSLLLVIKTAVS